MPKFQPGDRIRHNQVEDSVYVYLGTARFVWCSRGTLETQYHRIPTPEEVRAYKEGLQARPMSFALFEDSGKIQRLRIAHSLGRIDGAAEHRKQHAAFVALHNKARAQFPFDEWSF